MSGEHFSVADLAIDHVLAQTAGGMQFLLDVTPVNADDVRRAFVDGDVDEPEFTYRPLEVSPDFSGHLSGAMPARRSSFCRSQRWHRWLR